MLLVYVLVLLAGCSLVNAERKYNALRFELESRPYWSYIQWSPVNISSATAHLSVCTWVRKRYQAPEPMVLSYKQADAWDNGMILGDDGYYNYVVGTHLRLQSDYNVPDGKWFHVCWTWSTWARKITVYLNGEEIGSRHTNQRELSTGGTMCLGNTASSHKDSRYIFGGDMFKLNIFNEVLSHSEIRRMASDICSPEEENLNASRILKWEDIILKKRTGTVIEISTGCNVAEAELLIQTQQKLRLIEEMLQNTEQELAETKFNLTRQLDNVTDKKDNDGLYLTLTIVFGTLSAILLILLATLRLR